MMSRKHSMHMHVHMVRLLLRTSSEFCTAALRSSHRANSCTSRSNKSALWPPRPRESHDHTASFRAMRGAAKVAQPQARPDG
eukprot:CAMPEP_0181207782 /NCGR_PEP_ID=MMETSP1096-20121128/21771_1 /TAXON_ID=156174 ORGANISM="Chrysochromulina ericina, Strain CCMP281" /NCGR_SAMPLE_ID=MMETSP1096 /ASSEMBLY_ACC=CAM_ASM_000453 /LENGTH=81 /DNA_ID=CAMNT_0023298809 /DNA_START=293 /DNA_END=538 /DNA_ORIENTATION=-